MNDLTKLLDDFEYAVIARCQGYGTSIRLKECRTAILAAHEAKKQQDHLTSDAVVRTEPGEENAAGVEVLGKCCCGATVGICNCPVHAARAGVKESSNG